jgi:hypothetical protein
MTCLKCGSLWGTETLTLGKSTMHFCSPCAKKLDNVICSWVEETSFKHLLIVWFHKFMKPVSAYKGKEGAD